MPFETWRINNDGTETRIDTTGDNHGATNAEAVSAFYGRGDSAGEYVANAAANRDPLAPLFLLT